MKLIQNKLFTAFLFYGWLALIIIGCSLPGNEIPKVNVFDQFDKVVHYVFYFVLCILGYLHFGLSKKSIIALATFSIVFSFIIEFYQLRLVAGRSFDVWDGIAGSCGALCSVYLYKFRKYIVKLEG